MEERQSRLSNMDWKRFRPYLCVRLIPQNSMFSNFCHVLNSQIYNKKDIRKGRNSSITIILPISIGKHPQFFTSFDFIIKKVN